MSNDLNKHTLKIDSAYFLYEIYDFFEVFSKNDKKF